MKLLIFFFFPILLIAQVPYPDTLTLTNGKKFSCLITGINDSKIDMIYADNKSESVILKAVDQLSIEELGVVYKSNDGFTSDVQIVEVFIDERNKEREELARLSALEQYDTEVTTFKSGNVTETAENKNWSFGVLYVPYYSGTKYVLNYYNYYPPSPPVTYSYSDFETNLEGQFSYGIVSGLRVTLDITYSSSFAETRYERHHSGNYIDDDGTLTTYGLNLFDFTIGVRYYFIDIIKEKVSIYALAGIGKQFAFAKSNYEELFPPDPDYTVKDNAEDYLQDLNSPFHFNIGFGAEYFFNESLSLASNIRVLYSAVSGEYYYEFISESETDKRSEEYSSSDVITRFGLGLNFYF